MNKRFVEVFPQLHTDDEMSALLAKTTVEKVSLTTAGDLLRIFVVCDTWIKKQTVYALEEAIKKQYFAAEPVVVKIIEKFRPFI